MSPWVVALCAALALFQIVAAPALLLRKNDLADVLWGPAFFLSAMPAAFCSTLSPSNFDARKWLALALLFVWGLRLFVHVGRRNLSHLDREDVRYGNWRKRWGSTWIWRSYLQVFVLQALILYVFLVPVIHILANPDIAPSIFTALGLVVWLIGFGFEAVADEQLRRFKALPSSKGKLMTTGLWSWSRHPNYFGEITLWWGIWLIAMETPSAWWTAIGPLGVTYLILRVSGVSMLEDLMRSRPGFDRYAKETSPWLPLPPGFYQRFVSRKSYTKLDGGSSLE